MREWQSQSHVRWYCRYHVVWVPKYRKRAIFWQIRRGIGRIVRELCQRYGVELVEGHALSDHVHVLLGIPPKFSVANTVGFLKGKSAIRISIGSIWDGNATLPATTSGRAGTASARSVWPKRSSAITSGSRRQTRRSRKSWNLANRRPLRGAFIIPPPQGAVADYLTDRYPSNRWRSQKARVWKSTFADLGGDGIRAEGGARFENH